MSSCDSALARWSIVSSILDIVETMSSSATPPAPPAPQASALPPTSTEPQPSSSQTATKSALPSPVKPPRKPLLRLEFRDLSSAGSRAFLRLLHASTALEVAVDHVLRLLYSNLETQCIPPTRSITLVLRSMPGVAYTTGLDLDDDHKEIHFSTDYINGVPENRQKEEMLGVITHEMVHCWQHNALGTAPGGLIEGIADWVRLKAGYAPPHWRRRADCEWDAGYERTGYFLEWLEEAHGQDVVRKINEGMRGCKYESGEFWGKCCGESIEKLWEKYKATLGDHDGKGGKGKKGEDSQGKQTEEKVEDSEKRQSKGEGEENEKPQVAEKAAAQDDDVTEDAEHHDASQDPAHEDTRTPREKARRGGRMHVPVRPTS
ncbi:peptidase of plants and bacteria-domain-containing protein [Massariosphaeria phaeospora]|uniref:Peptidase of plants and bacteria-domain-containing protein n=1 Tax=Massariosphaeria phaeospora TaxID=100035 RepID=A0A7C8ICP0_9PLEO|nr:peptidase of plants and bacteria-domain-containing protein [Massariosphaeria phaeospora]